MTKNLRNLLDRYASIQNLTGSSGAEIYRIPELGAYLKIAEAGSIARLGREREVLGWLKGKLDVPDVLKFEEHDGKEFSLVSEITGVTAPAYVENLENREQFLSFVAKVGIILRRLHSLPIDGCELNMGLDVKLAWAAKNIENGLVDEDDFDEDNAGRTGADIYQELLDKKPVDEDLVFTHGDVSLPNIIMMRGEVNGLIDLGLGGVADRYQDISLCLRSFIFDSRWTDEAVVKINEIFCKAYGIESVDEDKLYYYRLLDELF